MGGQADGYGECRATNHYDREGRLTHLTVDRADPRILVSEELLEMLLLYGPGPGVEFREGPGSAPWPQRQEGQDYEWFRQGSRLMRGWVLTVRGENRTVVYRLGDYLPERFAYAAEWPD